MGKRVVQLGGVTSTIRVASYKLREIDPFTIVFTDTCRVLMCLGFPEALTDSAETRVFLLKSSAQFPNGLITGKFNHPGGHIPFPGKWDSIRKILTGPVGVNPVQCFSGDRYFSYEVLFFAHGHKIRTKLL